MGTRRAWGRVAPPLMLGKARGGVALLLALALAVSAAAAIFPACGGSATQGVTSDAHASACASCHATQAEAWSGSRHAASGASPVFAALLPRVAAAWGDDARARCVACHTPKHGGDDGIGCVACHAATGNAAERDGKLIVDLASPLSGPFADAAPTSAHGSRRYDFLGSPSLCGTCHEVTGPGLFVEPTLTEYRASPAAGSALTCVTCHLPEIDPGPIATSAMDARGAAIARPRRDHGFAGIDPAWGAPADDAARAADRTKILMTSALALDAIASADGGIDVTLTNFAGHAVPTGATFLRRIWIDVTFTDAAGKSAIATAVLTLGGQPTKAGMPVALITDADAIAPSTVAAGAARTVHVVPPDAIAAPVHARATLRATAIDPAVLEALGLGERATEVPIHEVAAIDVALE